MKIHSLETAQVMMTLSAIAYEHQLSQLKLLLSDKHLATNGDWELAWGPAQKDHKAFLAYVVRHQISGDYAVVIRGSVLSEDYIVETIIDWWDNLDIFSFRPYSGDPDQGSISSGMSDAFDQVKAMRDPQTHLTLMEFLSGIAPQNLYITGHSLGGCLASIVCGWIRDQKAATNVIAYTFAGPTAGDAKFASFVGTHDFYRYWNEWDFVPQGFQASTMLPALDWYPPPGKTLTYLERAFIKTLIDGLPQPIPYQQPCGIGIMLDGEIFENDSFTGQIAAQHDHNYYLKLLGAPPVAVAAT